MTRPMEHTTTSSAPAPTPGPRPGPTPGRHHLRSALLLAVLASLIAVIIVEFITHTAHFNHYPHLHQQPNQPGLYVMHDLWRTPDGQLTWGQQRLAGSHLILIETVDANGRPWPIPETRAADTWLDGRTAIDAVPLMELPVRPLPTWATASPLYHHHQQHLAHDDPRRLRLGFISAYGWPLLSRRAAEGATRSGMAFDDAPLLALYEGGRSEQARPTPGTILWPGMLGNIILFAVPIWLALMLVHTVILHLRQR